MGKEKLADRIKQLVDISSTLIMYSQKFKELHNRYLPKTLLDQQKYKTSEISLILRFLNSSFCYDALLNINSILSQFQRDPEKKEQSIFELIELEDDPKKKSKLLNVANSFREKLEKKNLHKWRHKFVAHKDIESAGDTVIMYLNFIEDEYIRLIIELLSEINEFLINNFDLNYKNSFNQLYAKSFNKMIELFETEINMNSDVQKF